MSETAKKKGALLFTRRDALNWGIASPLAAIMWFLVLSFVFEELNLYETLEDIAEFAPAILIGLVAGGFVGAAQAVALPRSLGAHRKTWFWNTFWATGAGMFFVFVLEELNIVFNVDYFAEFLWVTVLLWAAAAPLIAIQSWMLYRFHALLAHAARFSWLNISVRWFFANGVFLAMLIIPDLDNVTWVSICLMVWGLSTAMALTSILHIRSLGAAAAKTV